MLKIIGDRIGAELTPVCLLERGEAGVEVRVLLEGQTALFVLETAEVPQNFLQIGTLTEHL
jgi:hypothetical protein